MDTAEAGPGALSTKYIGQKTVASSFHLTPRLIMAYAASIKDANPRYFDDLNGPLTGHPFLAFAFQWATRFSPQVPPNPRAAPYGVHVSTDLRLTRPLCENDLITMQGQVMSTRAIRPGVLQLSRYTMTDGSGTLIGELDQESITRGATLEGEPKTQGESPPVPQAPIHSEPLWTQEIEITPDAAQIYTECADIYNPIHTERRAAVEAGLPDVILHGSATQAIACSALVNRCLNGEVRQVRRFVGALRAMVLLDSTLTLRCLAEVDRENGRDIFFDLLNADGQPAIAGGYLRVEP